MKYLLAFIFLGQLSLLLGFSRPFLTAKRSNHSFRMAKTDNNNFFLKPKHLAGIVSLWNVFFTVIPSQAVTPLEYVNPKDAVILTDDSSSTQVKAGREGLKSLIDKIQAIKSDLNKDSQVEVSSRVQSEFRLDAVRDVLNQFNGAFSEDTQRGSDRLIRLFLQDVTNLEKEGEVKVGKQRSETRVKNLIRTLDKAESTLKELQSFYP